MKTLGQEACRWWCKNYPTPATQQQLENLAALYNLTLKRTGLNDSCWAMQLPNPTPVLDPNPVLDFFANSPIERYIEHLAQWRRGRI